MRHFTNGAYHMATITSDPRVIPFGWRELKEGNDGKCEWCRAADRAREQVLVDYEDEPF